MPKGANQFTVASGRPCFPLGLLHQSMDRCYWPALQRDLANKHGFRKPDGNAFPEQRFLALVDGFVTSGFSAVGSDGLFQLYAWFLIRDQLFGCSPSSSCGLHSSCGTISHGEDSAYSRLS